MSSASIRQRLHVCTDVSPSDAVTLGHEFAAAKKEGRPPGITDLWEDDVPMGPYVLNALRARELHQRDVHYIVRDGEVKIVNSSTGRVQPSSRWMDDLHQVCRNPSSSARRTQHGWAPSKDLQVLVRTMCTSH